VTGCCLRTAIECPDYEATRVILLFLRAHCAVVSGVSTGLSTYLPEINLTRQLKVPGRTIVQRMVICHGQHQRQRCLRSRHRIKPFKGTKKKNRTKAVHNHNPSISIGALFNIRINKICLNPFFTSRKAHARENISYVFSLFSLFRVRANCFPH
jgi:hypothetical protein